MKHLGDITKISGYDVPIVDIVTGGSPCQDLSVAGQRAGLAGERSGLFMEQVRIFKEMREHDRANGRTDVHVRPRYMVWENVPGALSSNKGFDFQAVLTEIVRIAVPNAPDVPMPDKGKWPNSGCIYDEVHSFSLAWRIHDAQYWGKTIRDSRTGDVVQMGTPQRRRRIALVADFGGMSAPEILFEREGLSGNPEQIGTARETVAGDSEGSSHTADQSFTQKFGGREVDSLGHKAGKGPLIQNDLSGTLGVSQDQTLFAFRKKAHPMNNTMPQEREPTDVNDTLNVFDNGDSRTPTAVVYALQGGGTTSQSGNGCAWGKDVQFTLNGLDVHGVAAVDVRNSTEDERITGPLQACSFKNVNSNNVTRTRKD